MTANQINYAKYLEDVRTHKATESINRRQAAAAERQATVAEANAVTNRYNAEVNKANSLINESAVGAQWYGAQANAAYQQAMAAVSQAQQEEQRRHNKTSETNEIIMSGQRVSAQNYATQKQAETTTAGQENQLNIAEMQIRGQIITSLINAGSSLGQALLKVGPEIGKLLQGG